MTCKSDVFLKPVPVAPISDSSDTRSRLASTCRSLISAAVISNPSYFLGIRTALPLRVLTTGSSSESEASVTASSSSFPSLASDSTVTG